MLIRPMLHLVAAWLLVLVGYSLAQAHGNAFESLHAGAAAVDISPIELPAIRNGGFIEAQSDRVDDRLHARSLVLASHDETIAICIVDSCMLPTDVCDAIKQLVNERIGISTDRILISATHTHTAPSTMSFCLGTRRDDVYTAQVIPQIARSIVIAHERLQPAQVGWAVVDGREFTNCRRWLTRRDRMGLDPFGERSVRAMMHPGYLNPDYVCPAGPIDPGLSVLSVTDRDTGVPICVLGNFSMHYFGAGPGFSADYFGQVATRLEAEIAKTYGPTDARIVGIMSQGTSGDLHWMDYSRPQRRVNRQQYADAIAARILEALSEIDYSHELTIEMAETRFNVTRRTPSEDRLAWATALNDERGDRPPRNRPEVYAQQAQWIHENPTAEIVLQAIRIGELGITAIPNEVYGITGLKLKKQSPLLTTFNLELANGAEGYIPPPSQHQLGGYTTWPARTAGLEKNAEPEIVERLLGLLEDVAHRNRRPIVDTPSDYSRAMIEARPAAYWRLGDLTEGLPRDEVDAIESQASGTLVRYLPGPDGDGFDVHPELNRATYFVDARLNAVLPDCKHNYSLSMWFWNGLPPELASESACLFVAESGAISDRLTIAGQAAPDGTGKLVLQVGDETAVGNLVLATRAWHHVAVVRRDREIAVYLDGRVEPEIRIPWGDAGEPSRESGNDLRLTFGGQHGAAQSFDGKLDEIAVFDRPLTVTEIETQYELAGVPRPELPVKSDGFARKASDDESLRRYADAILTSHPRAFWRLHDRDTTTATDAVRRHDARYEREATGLPAGAVQSNFSGGRVVAAVTNVGNTYSMECWMRNDLPVRARPVTGYLFCRGTDGANGAPGDSLGIGGTHSWTGCLFVYNGNERGEAVSGTTRLVPGRWNHVILVREGEMVRAFLNGDPEPEFEGRLPVTYPRDERQFFIGGRNDNFANFQGAIEEVSLYDRALSPREVAAHFAAASLERMQENSVDDNEEPPATSTGRSLDFIHVPERYRVE